MESSNYNKCSKFKWLEIGKISLALLTLTIGSASFGATEYTINDEKNIPLGLNNPGDSVKITSTGSISVTSESTALAISSSLMTGEAFIINDGIITATTLAENINTTPYASSIDVTTMGGNSSINNNGTIFTKSTNGFSVKGISSSCMEGNASIKNSGIITLSSTSSSYGILGNEMKDNSKIINTGTVNAYENGVYDANKYSINVGSMSTNALVENYGTLNGNLKIPGTFKNAGTVVLPYNANLGSDNYYIPRVKDFTNTSDGTLTISVFNTDESDKRYSQLSTTNATFESGSTIGVNVMSGGSASKLLINQILEDVVTAGDGNLSIKGTLNVTDNSDILDFKYKIDGDTIDLNIVEGLSIYDATGLRGGKKNALAAAKVLDKIKDAGLLPELISKLGALEGTALANAIASLSPDVANAVQGAAGQIASGIQGIVEMRQNVGFSGLNSGDQIFSDNQLWMKPYGSFGEQKDDDGINGFDLNAYGLGIGMDGEYAPNQKLGLAFFYTNANVETNNVNQEADLDVYTLLGYGSVPVIDDKTTFLYQASYSWQKTDTSRVALGDTISGDYTSKTASLNFKLLRDYQMNNSWLLQPLVEFTYRNFNSPSYTESNDNSIQSSSTTQAIAGIGVISHYKINDNSKIISSANVGYDLRDDDQSITSSLVPGYDFTTEGIDNGRYSYDVGVGYEIDLNKNSNLNFTYNLQGEGSEFTNNSFSAKYLYKF